MLDSFLEITGILVSFALVYSLIHQRFWKLFPVFFWVEMVQFGQWLVLTYYRNDAYNLFHLYHAFRQINILLDLWASYRLFTSRLSLLIVALMMSMSTTLTLLLYLDKDLLDQVTKSSVYYVGTIFNLLVGCAMVWAIYDAGSNSPHPKEGLCPTTNRLSFLPTSRSRSMTPSLHQ